VFNLSCLRSRSAAYLVGGIILGLVIAIVLFGRQADRLVLDNARLMDQVERLAAKAAQLEEALTTESRHPVKHIELSVTLADMPPDPHLQLMLEEALHEVLVPLIGVEVEEVSPEFLVQAVKRDLQIDGKTYHLGPRLIIISSTVRVEAAAVPPAASRPVAPF